MRGSHSEDEVRRHQTGSETQEGREQRPSPLRSDVLGFFRLPFLCCEFCAESLKVSAWRVVDTPVDPIQRLVQGVYPFGKVLYYGSQCVILYGHKTILLTEINNSTISRIRGGCA